MLSLFDRSGDECAQKRVGLERLRFELGVELTAEEPGMVLQLADFHIHPVRRLACELETVIGEDLLVFAIELVTVAMALADLGLTIRATSVAVVREQAGVRSEAHGS